MAKKKITFDPNAAFMEVQQQIVHDTDLSEQQQIVENSDLSQVEYDPMIDDGNMPYMASHGGQPYQQPYQQQQVPIQKGYVDVNNIQNFSNPQGQQQGQQNPQYQQQMHEAAAQEPGLDYGKASQNIGEMSNVMDSFNTVDKSTANHNDTELYAISVAIKTLSDAIKVLKDVDYWIPTQHERHAPQLKKVGQPIVKALSIYADKIGKMK